MKVTLTSPKSAGLISFLLTLPFVFLFLHVLLGIELSLGPLDPLINAEGSRLGSFIFLGAVSLLLVGFLVSLVPTLRDFRSGDGLMKHPINLLLTVEILFFMVMFVGAIIVDQYPCWIGVPNCD